MNQEAPVILTLKMDDKSQDFFNRLRTLHFPTALNYIDAHLTLFHNLGPDITVVKNSLLAYDSVKSFTMKVAGLRNLGNGVACNLESPELLKLHSRLRQQFESYLTRQNRQKFQPHITIQNKVLPEQAKTLLEQLQNDSFPPVVVATGISIWQYLGGPWRHVWDLCFTA